MEQAWNVHGTRHMVWSSAPNHARQDFCAKISHTYLALLGRAVESYISNPNSFLGSHFRISIHDEAETRGIRKALNLVNRRHA